MLLISRVQSNMQGHTSVGQMNEFEGDEHLVPEYIMQRSSIINIIIHVGLALNCILTVTNLVSVESSTRTSCTSLSGSLTDYTRNVARVLRYSKINFGQSEI